MEYLTTNDLESLCGESQGKINLAIAGMTMLMNETNEKVELLEGQTWFQRMSNTITGKNKMTVEEISKNRDKINVYMSEALSALYDRNCIDHGIILGMGKRLNELYASQIELKQIIGAFVNKLNQKIISIDNFHMLVEEINQRVYTNTNRIASICRVISQLDTRTVHDERKMSILIRAMEDVGILVAEEEKFSDFLVQLLEMSELDAGIITIMLDSASDEYVAEIARDIMYHYYFLPDRVRKMKSRKAVVEKLLVEREIDLEYRISTKEFYNSLIEVLSNKVVLNEIEENENKEKETVIKYIEDARGFLFLIRDMFGTWVPKGEEIATHSLRVEYSKFMNNVIDSLGANSYLGLSLERNLNNITYFLQNIHSQIKDFNVYMTNYEKANEISRWFTDINQQVNQNLATEGLGGYQNIVETFRDSIKNIFYNPEGGYTREIYSIKSLEEFPQISKIGCMFPLIGTQIKGYVLLYEMMFEYLYKCVQNDDKMIKVIGELIARYPIDYNNQYEDVFIRKGKKAKQASEYIHSCIGINYKKDGSDKSVLGYADIGELNKSKLTAIVLRFYNIPYDNYTVCRDIIKNKNESWVITDDMADEYVEVEWGEWIGRNDLEMVFRNEGKNSGTLNMKIYIEEDPSIAAYIYSGNALL